MTTRNEQTSETSFLEATESGARGGLVSEFFGFMRENAKWWLLPFLIVFGLLGIALILGTSGAAPFIYTMF